MRPLLLLALLLLPACASSTGAAATKARPATQTINGGGLGSVTVSNRSSADVLRLPYAVDDIWRILPSAFDSVGIPITSIDQGAKSIGNDAYKVRQRLGKTPLSRYLDCGNTQIGPNADSYDVVLSVRATVTPDGAAGKAVLSTLVEAQARPATFNQAYNRCSSRGVIEARVAAIVKARLSR